jgi:hypothetical protein
MQHNQYNLQSELIKKNIKNKKSVGGSRAATLSTMVLEIRDRRATYSTPSELLGPATQTPTVN